MEIKIFCSSLYEPLLFQKISLVDGRMMSEEYNIESFINSDNWTTSARGIIFDKRDMIQVTLSINKENFYTEERRSLGLTEPYKFVMLATTPEFIKTDKWDPDGEKEELFFSQFLSYLTNPGEFFKQKYDAEFHDLCSGNYSYEITRGMTLYLGVEDGKIKPKWSNL